MMMFSLYATHSNRKSSQKHYSNKKIERWMFNTLKSVRLSYYVLYIFEIVLIFHGNCVLRFAFDRFCCVFGSSIQQKSFKIIWNMCKWIFVVYLTLHMNGIDLCYGDSHKIHTFLYNNYDGANLSNCFCWSTCFFCNFMLIIRQFKI